VNDDLLELKIIRLGRVYTGVSVAKVRQWIAERRISADDLVRPVGSERWMKVSLAPELAPTAAPPAPTASHGSKAQPAVAVASAAATEDDPTDDLGIPQPTNSRRRRSRKQLEDTEMDMTPMIDVTFQLLIFFMLANNVANHAAIEVPFAKYGKGIAPDGKQAILIDQQGAYYLGEKAEPELAEPSLETLLDQVAENASSAEQPLEVIVSAHKAVHHRRLRELMERLGEVPNIGPVRLGVEEEQ
jgi:biopolymer transport protein ExbD